MTLWLYLVIADEVISFSYKYLWMSIPELLQQDKQDKLENHNGNIIRHAIVLSKANKSAYVSFNLVQYLEFGVLYWRHHRKNISFLVLSIREFLGWKNHEM